MRRDAIGDDFLELAGHPEQVEMPCNGSSNHDRVFPNASREDDRVKSWKGGRRRRNGRGDLLGKHLERQDRGAVAALRAPLDLSNVGSSRDRLQPGAMSEPVSEGIV